MVAEQYFDLWEMGKLTDCDLVTRAFRKAQPKNGHCLCGNKVKRNTRVTSFVCEVSKKQARQI